MPVYFHSEYPKFTLKPKLKYKKWLSNVILAEGKSIGNINFIFVDDQFLLEVNMKYLQHNNYTDVITFEYTEGEKISGDIYISIDRVKENALKFDITTQLELNRVMIHGILHLLDYNDITGAEKMEIRKKEDQYLSLID